MSGAAAWWALIPGIASSDQPVSRGHADRVAAAVCAQRLIPIQLGGGHAAFDRTPTGKLAEELRKWLAAAKDHNAASTRRLALVLVCDSTPSGAQPPSGENLHKGLTDKAEPLSNWLAI